jgi:alpha-glucosidase (family GH31 glycosyl hydrolase)
VYSDSETLSAFARFATIFAALGDYRALLMDEAANHGWPLVRPMFWHYPEEDEAWALAGTQFMVGPHVLVAPVLKEGGATVDVYLPRGR